MQYILVNGILSSPGSHSRWTDRGVTWIHQNTPHKAEKFEYWSGPLTRRLRMGKHVRALAELIQTYSGERIVLAGHSNGAEIICLALRGSLSDVSDIHLLSPACESDFEKNGLNAAMISSKVENVFVYTGGQDTALKWAMISKKLLSWLGLGYGTLGLTGPVNAAYASRVKWIDEPNFGHCSWFSSNNFEYTMKRICSL